MRVLQGHPSFRWYPLSGEYPERTGRRHGTQPEQLRTFQHTATQWKYDEFRVSERSKKRTPTSSSSSAPDHNSAPQVATVTAHCDGCGKLGHKREECKSNGTHPDFNKTRPLIGCSSYNASHVTTQLPRWTLNPHRPRVGLRHPTSPGELRLLPLRSQ